MLQTLRDHFSFLLKKSAIVDEYIDQGRALASFAAARNFFSAPGHIHSGFLRVEADYLKKLEGANIEALREAVEFALKMRGLEYDEDLLHARLVFERDKSQLLADLQREVADMRHIRELGSHTIRLALIEIALREALLSYVETSTASQLEALRLEEAQQEQRALPYQESLAAGVSARADAKVDFANERLRIIQPIRDLIAAQRETLEYERDFLMPEMEILIDKKGELIEVQTDELLPAMTELAGVITEWATARPAVIAQLVGKAQAALALANEEFKLIAPRDDVADVRGERAGRLDEIIEPLLSAAAAIEAWAIQRPQLSAAITEKAAQSVLVAGERKLRANAALAHTNYEATALPHIEVVAEKRAEKAEKMLELLPLYESLAGAIDVLVEKIPDHIAKIEQLAALSPDYIDAIGALSAKIPDRVAQIDALKALIPGYISEINTLSSKSALRTAKIEALSVLIPDYVSSIESLAEKIPLRTAKIEALSALIPDYVFSVNALAEKIPLRIAKIEQLAGLIPEYVFHVQTVIDMIPDYIDAVQEKSGKYATIISNDAAIVPEKVAAAIFNESRAVHLRSNMIGERTELMGAKINRAVNLGLQALAEKEVANAELSLAQDIQLKLPHYVAKGQAAMEKAEALKELAAELHKEAAARNQIAEFRASAATYRHIAALLEKDVSIANDDITSVRDEIDHIRLALEILRVQEDAASIVHESELASSFSEARMGGVARRANAISYANSMREFRVSTETANKLAGRVTAAGIEIDADADYHNSYGKHRYDEQTGVAKINALKEITSKLIHQIT